LRSAAELVADLADTAVAAPLPASLRGEGSAPPQTWADLLFDGDELADDTEPSQALLRAVSGLHAGLVEHEDRLSDLARGWLMSERLGVPRLPIVPDRVVVVVDGDPKRMPVVLPPDSLLKAGKGPLGERLYATTEPLTVLGAPILGAHSHRILDSGADVAAWRRTDLSNEKGPVFAPFGEASDPAAGHELYVTSDLLRFTKGTLVITLTFDNVTVNGVSPASMTAVANVLKALRWEISTAEGMRAVSAAGGPSTSGIELTFSVTGGSAPQPLAGTPRYFLRGRFPASGATGFSRATALGFAFRTLRLKVDGYDVPPDAGYTGDGLLDVTKEFEPFGPVPRRGDSFFLRLDEAFGKPLTYVKVTLSRLGSGDTLQPAEYGKKQSNKWLKTANSVLKEKGVKYTLDDSDIDAPDFTVRWERFDGAVWQSFFKDTTDFQTVSQSFTGTVPRPFSTATSIGGSPGNYVRAFLYHGDFGWDDFQATMAQNAYEIATGHPGNVVVAIPPDPPVVSQVRIRYTTEELSSASGRLGVYARNALSSVASLLPAGAGGAIEPFRQDEEGFDGTFYLGVGEPLPLGEVVTVYARVDEADACAAVQGDTAVVWQYRSGGGAWRDLPCVDGTLGLRQSGILRFVAPLDWALGAPETDEAAGRWVRARTHAPGAAGRIRLLRTDAVEAAYRLAAGHALDDATPASPIAAGAVTALRAPVLGIKKVANPAPSAGGRGPEPDAAFFARSGGVLRHRNRAITPWDVEELVRAEFPELALVRCLPHHARSGAEAECAPGWLAVVAVPRSSERAPVPTVRLAAAIEAFALEHGPTDLSVAVLCPLYAEVGVRATLHLVPGVAAASAREAVESALRGFLHPLSTVRAGGFGEPLYRSAVVRFLEEQASVDHVSGVEFLAPYAGLERVDVDACRGLVASGAVHELFAEAVL
jgi:hypothetical protein